MNIRQLEIFNAVADCESMTQAASELFVSQPAISKAIRELEADLHLKLFDRIDNRLRLNADGVEFRIKARHLLADYQALADFGQDQAQRLPLRVGCSLTLAQASLPQAAQQFSQQYPTVQLRLFAENVAQIKSRLLHGDLDVAFVEGQVDRESFQATPLSSYVLTVVAKPGFVKVNELTCAQIQTVPWLLREKGSTLSDTLMMTLRSLDITVKPVLESVNTTVLVNAAIAGLGLTVLPRVLAQPYLQGGQLVALSLPQGMQMKTENFAITLKDLNHADVIDAMIRCFQNVL